MYTLQNFYDALDKLAKLAAPVGLAVQEAKDASEHAKAEKDTLRNMAANAVSIGFLLSMGKPSIIAHAKERIPDSSSKAVRISESLGVLDKWPEPVVLAQQWAAGDFKTTPVADAIKAVKPAPDTLKALGKAVDKALSAGETVEAIMEAVEKALTAPAQVEAEQQKAA